MECCTEMARIGKAAPNFQVEGFDPVKGSFEKYSLADYRGKYVLLFFYPGDFTYVCPTELTSLASLKSKLDEAKVQVLVISTDSKYAHKQWNESELSVAVGGNYPYPMLTDTMGKIGAAYSFFDEESGTDLRGAVLIDKKGVVQLIHNHAPALGRNPHELLRCVLALKEHDDGGKVIPACWNPGDEAIEPSFENSGKVVKTYEKVIQGVMQGGNWRCN